MALNSTSNPEEDEQNERNYIEQLDEEEDARGEDESADRPSHHPSAPPDELFDLSTTVDPTYIISLIRKLVPVDARKEGITRGSSNGFMDENGAMLSVEGGSDQVGNNEHENMDIFDDESSFRSQVMEVSRGDDVWEEHGCVLWDLAASRTHAELMVQNLVLEVLSANLTVTQSVRVKEICLGIIGNLGCHSLPMMHIVAKEGLIGIILDQLFLDDPQCLSEAFRILTLGLQSGETGTWGEALEADHILSRITWVAENTLNPRLLEKSVEFLLAVLQSREEVSSALIPLLMKLGLSSLLINLLSTEMSMETGERGPQRLSVLDVILRAIEALSSLDVHSQEICSDKTLFRLACNVVKIPDKAEVANSCVTAAVLLANMLADVPDLASEISQDLSLLESLLDLFPFASDDPEARSALWSTIARLLVRVNEPALTPSSLHRYVTVLVSKSDSIEDELLDRQTGPSMETADNEPNARSIALQRTVDILTKWRDGVSLDDQHDPEDDENVRRLLECCSKHLRRGYK
ncbi:Protein saal1 [Linum grandiflorum]